MNKEEIKDNDMFQCKMYITDLETGKDSKEIDVSNLVFNDWIEFEFGNYEDEDYGQLPYKDFKFFINDYSVTFYSPQYQKALKEIDRLNNIINELEKHFFNDSKIIKEYNIEHSENTLDNYSQYYLDKLKELIGDKDE